MTRVQTYAPSTLVASQEHPGAEAELVIENLSDKRLSGSNIVVSISAPELVEVVVEHARFDDGTWYPRYDLLPNDMLRIPIFIRPQVYREESGGEIEVEVRIEGVVAKESISLAT